MRAVILGLASLTIAGNAMAADYLRGSSYDPPRSSSYDWSGVYVGGQFGYSESNVGFGNTERTVFTSQVLRPTIEAPENWTTWPVLPSGDGRTSSYGGFVGYNSQWGEVVIGLELNYSHTALRVNGLSVVVVDLGAPTIGLATYTAQARINDYASLRMRAGYAWDWFMPYATAGVAVGRMDVLRSVAVTYQPAAPVGFLPYTDTETRSDAYAFGYSLGAGVDIGLMSNVFVRGEYEFVQLNSVKGVTANLNTYRAAVAVKF